LVMILGGWRMGCWSFLFRNGEEFVHTDGGLWICTCSLDPGFFNASFCSLIFYCK
jgi:hypothetical protein